MPSACPLRPLRCVAGSSQVPPLAKGDTPSPSVRPNPSDAAPTAPTFSAHTMALFAHKKIIKEKGAEPEAFEVDVAQAIRIHERVGHGRATRRRRLGRRRRGRRVLEKLLAGILAHLRLLLACLTTPGWF